jgi:hypothetical protein
LLQASRRHTRRSFAVAALSAAVGYGFYQWVARSRAVGMLQEPLRWALQANAALSQAVFGDRAMAPTYPLSRAENLRVNGVFGLKKKLVPESWRLQMVGVEKASSRPEYVSDVTAWEYRYESSANHEDPGHDTKVRPRVDTAEKMAPAQVVGTEKALERRPGSRPETRPQPRSQARSGETWQRGSRR